MFLTSLYIWAILTHISKYYFRCALLVSRIMINVISYSMSQPKLPHHVRLMARTFGNWTSGWARTNGMPSRRGNVGLPSHRIYRTVWVRIWIGVNSWWRHQMETFSELLALCEGNPSVTGGFLSQRPVTRSFEIFFDLCLNKQLSKQPRRWWFEREVWRHCNVK